MLVQLSVQNCIILQCFVTHAAHGWKSYWVYFHTQQTAPHFDFPLESYNSFSEDRSENWQQREDHWKSISWKSFHILYLFIFISCSYLYMRVVPGINIPVLPSKQRLFDNQNTTSLFNCVLTKTREKSLSLCSCIFLRGDYRSGRIIGTQSVLLVHWFKVV